MEANGRKHYLDGRKRYYSGRNNKFSGRKHFLNGRKSIVSGRKNRNAFKLIRTKGTLLLNHQLAATKGGKGSANVVQSLSISSFVSKHASS